MNSKESEGGLEKKIPKSEDNPKKIKKELVYTHILGSKKRPAVGVYKKNGQEYVMKFGSKSKPILNRIIGPGKKHYRP